ncbi:hypothetical protein C8F04DRAFT_421026 [Mycena alexandri]|uniref:Secreted protein n=1 Tax=Mycena alexandri TaxID=1745969 RepID=A0AAD6T0T2_9AGAR|nr:hypothetical protein C8F04DRAFT_421026 [Mycena alexandri]
MCPNRKFTFSPVLDAGAWILPLLLPALPGDAVITRHCRCLHRTTLLRWDLGLRECVLSLAPDGAGYEIGNAYAKWFRLDVLFLHISIEVHVEWRKCSPLGPVGRRSWLHHRLNASNSAVDHSLCLRSESMPLCFL